jgi:hypothetical protein
MSSPHTLVFPDRDTVVEMALTLNGIRFPQPGIYLVDYSVRASGWLTQGFLFSEMETFMEPEQQQQNPRHQPETISTASQQSFEDPEGGLPLDSPAVHACELQRRGKPADRRPPQTNSQVD